MPAAWPGVYSEITIEPRSRNKFSVSLMTPLSSDCCLVSWKASPSNVTLWPVSKRKRRTGGVTHVSKSHGRTTSYGGISLKLKTAVPTASARSAVGASHSSVCASIVVAGTSAPATIFSSPTVSEPKAQCAAPIASKPLPVTVTVVPPCSEPLAGEMPLTFGGA